MLIKSEKELQKYTQEFDALSGLMLSSTSPSGVRYCLEFMGQAVESAIAGTQVRTAWPPDVAEQQRGQCLYPMDYNVYVQTGWCIEEIAVGMWNVEPVLCDVPAAAVREALEIRREIRLLAHLVTLDKAATVHSSVTPEHMSKSRISKKTRSLRAIKPGRGNPSEEAAMQLLNQQSLVSDTVRQARSAALLEALR